jgi:hypothetical protein
MIKEDNMLRKFQLVIAGIVIIAANQAVSFAVSAARPAGSLPAGTVRFTVAEAEATTTTNQTTYYDVIGLAAPFTVPNGQHGDVMVVFCGEMEASAGLAVRATVGGVVATPSKTAMWHATTIGESRCAVFYRLSVPAGSYNAKIQWSVPSGIGYMYYRTMIVTVNNH